MYHRIARTIGLLLLAMLLAAALPPARAQDLVRSIASEYSRSLDRGNVVGTAGDDLFGDETSLYTGETQFRAVDIDLPGNDTLPVRFGRRFVVEETHLQSYDRGQLGNWEIDVPYLTGTFTRQFGWQVAADDPDARCSSQRGPRAGSGFQSPEFWYGVRMHVPGAGDQELLLPTATSLPGPTTGGPYRWLTKGLWHFECVPALANDADFDGEGFVAVSPGGLRYHFDFMEVRSASSVSKPALPHCSHTVWVNPFQRGRGEYEGSATSPDFLGTGLSDGVQSQPCPSLVLQRSEVRLYATRIEDRFGNHVDYAYQGGRLVGITANDGRSIAIGYDGDGHVASATAGNATWRYAYVDHQLDTVTLPDGSKWRFDSNIDFDVGLFLVIEHDYEMPPSQTNNNCLWPGYGGREVVYTITHPSGAVGEFRLAPNRIARTYMPKLCLITTGTPGYFYHPPYLDVFSLKAKTITGPGLAARSWTFAYEGLGGTPLSFQNFCLQQPTAATCTPYDTTRVTDPAGVVTAWQFGNKFQETEGKLQATRVYSAAGALVDEVLDTYVDAGDIARQAFPDVVGNSLQARGNFEEEANRPRRRTQRNRDGVQYVRDIEAFDAYANPLRVRRSSALGTALDTFTYHHDLAAWVLALPESTAVDGIETSRTDYDGDTALPVASYGFGALQATMTYRADGTLATVRDALGNATAVGGWRRGLPQAIAFADGTSVSAVVDDLGRIERRTDPLGSQWNYTYDALGRPRTIAYPAGDTVAWAPTTFAFVPVATSEYGLPSGHWRRIEQTGAGRTSTWFDAMWRPVLTLAEDTGNAATRSYVVRRYDAAGREAFVSYPVATLASVDDNLPGTRTTYDALGRVVRVERDSERGVLASTTQYQAGGALRTTDARGKASTTRYQAFDAPDLSSPVAIDLPAGVEVRIDRDVFGKPLAITRRGPYAGSTLSATRRYVYDANQRLCKAINPESGADVHAYDAAGNEAWIALGSTLTGATCDRDAVPAGSRTMQSFDVLNRLKTRTVPDGIGSLAYAYAPDGLVQSVTATNPGNATVTTAYAYDKRRLMTSEVASQPNWYAWTIGYGYDANGHLATLTYPSALSVAYAPNALGQPTQAGPYATSVAYHPDGAIKSFVFGNGIVHSATQNARGLPLHLRDAGASTILDDTFAYDAGGNLTDLVDAAQGGRTTRGMAYDDLDRLTAAVAPQLWSDATYAYDPLDNLRATKLGNSGFSYNYDGNNRLTSLAGTGGTTYAYQTDARGNLTSDGRRAYVFDQANRLSAVTGKESYRYDGLGRRALTSRTGSLAIHLYDAAGQLLRQHDTRRNLRIDNIYLGDTVVAELTQPLGTTTSTVRYVHTDFQRTPVAKTSATGAVVERTAYTPYGAPFDRPVEGVGYTGHNIDLDTGLVYAQQRYYDPLLGRFLSADPIDTDTTTGSSFTRFAYGADNPYSASDPDGRQVQRPFQLCELPDRTTWDFPDHPSHANATREARDAETAPVEPGSREATRVYAKEAGSVLVVGWQNPQRHQGAGAGAGYRIKIDIGHSRVRLYGHMQPDSIAVAPGERVAGREYLGNYANPTNGHSTGPHVHDQLMDMSSGRRVDIDPNRTSPLGANGGRVTTPFGVRDASHPNAHQGTDWVYDENN